MPFGIQEDYGRCEHRMNSGSKRTGTSLMLFAPTVIPCRELLCVSLQQMRDAQINEQMILCFREVIIFTRQQKVKQKCVLEKDGNIWLSTENIYSHTHIYIYFFFLFRNILFLYYIILLIYKYF